MKTELLSVSEALLAQEGAVSHQVAEAMAVGARKKLGCDIALSVTGVAGPDPDEKGTDVGTAFVAIATNEGCYVRALRLGKRRDRVRIMCAHHAFDLARRYLSGLSYQDS